MLPRRQAQEGQFLGNLSGAVHGVDFVSFLGDIFGDGVGRRSVGSDFLYYGFLHDYGGSWATEGCSWPS